MGSLWQTGGPVGRAQKDLGWRDRPVGHVAALEHVLCLLAVGAADVLLLSASQIDAAHLFSLGLSQEGNFLWK